MKNYNIIGIYYEKKKQTFIHDYDDVHQKSYTSNYSPATIKNK